MSINIGFDTEFQDYRDGSGKNRRVLSLQMTISISETLIRFFFLMDPRYQEVTAEGGMISLKYCLADILDDLKKCYFPEFPLVRKEGIIYKNKEWEGHDSFKVVDFKAMKDFTITAWSKDKYNLLINESKKSFVADCTIALLEVIPQSTSREEFISGMKQRGWSVQWEEKRKHIVFQNENGNKVRDTNIEKTFAGLEVNKEALTHEFERQNEIRHSAPHIKCLCIKRL